MDFKNIILALRNERGFSQEQLAKVLHVSKSTVAMWETGQRLPSVEKYEEISLEMARTGEFFGLQIKGDSMEPKISDGDVVIVRQQNDAESGDIVIATINGDEATCKRIRKYRDGIELVSSNPCYEPMFFSNEEIENKPVRIIGRVVELRAKF